MHLQPGILLKGGTYLVEKVLGQGGFGITYLAVQSGLNRRVAIKEFFMKEHCNRDADTSHVSVPSVGSRDMVRRFRNKFIKEAQTIAGMDNHHIITIHDVFEENGTAYYVMEYLSCGCLSERIPAEGLPESEAVDYIRQIADALSYIHQHKILHLDIKPSNVLFRKPDEAVLIDFGISKHYDEDGDGQTSSTPVGVSEGYAPTEQYEREGVSSFSASTDIYSLGATLYCLLSGHRPPKASIVLNDGLPPLPASVSEPVRTAVERAMSPRRKDRPQTVPAFLGLLDSRQTRPQKRIVIGDDTHIDLDKVRPQSRPGTADISRPPVKPAHPVQLVEPPKDFSKSAKPRRRGLVLGLVSAAVIAIAGFLIFRSYLPENVMTDDIHQEEKPISTSSQSYNDEIELQNRELEESERKERERKEREEAAVREEAKKKRELEESQRKERELKEREEAKYKNLSTSGTANSYIVSKAGKYRFKSVKGNSSASVGSVASVEVLWESFGTSETPLVGSLVKNVSYEDGYICFSTPEIFKEGNAVIAAKDSSGEILWSWHIWLTDQPKGQTYHNSAGTMMDRNLGATSATPGDVGALGLLYQWGRKDPFLGSSSISDAVEAKSTASWPSAVSSSSNKGTVEYAVMNPMTYIYGSSSSDYDWHYSSRNNSLWKSSKTIYDPCPAGWRVPDGGDNGVWSNACGSSSPFSYSYDISDEGMNFSGKFGSASVIWYPASGYRSNNDGSLCNVGNFGSYWSVTPRSSSAYFLSFRSSGYVNPSYYYYRAYGQSVRCLKE